MFSLWLAFYFEAISWLTKRREEQRKGLPFQAILLIGPWFGLLREFGQKIFKSGEGINISIFLIELIKITFDVPFQRIRASFIAKLYLAFSNIFLLTYSYHFIRTIAYFLLCSFYQNQQKISLEGYMNARALQDDYETDIISDEMEGRIKDFHACHPTLLTINDIMDDIHREVASKVSVPKIVENKQERIRCRKWGRKQTAQFFEVLARVGPDFTCMEKDSIFAGKRCKGELRNKFHKAQKKEMQRVDRSLDIFYDRSRPSLLNK